MFKTPTAGYCRPRVFWQPSLEVGPESLQKSSPKPCKIKVRGGLGGSWGWSWRLSWLKRLFEAVLANFGPRWDTPFVGNLDQLGDNLGPSWGQDGPSWRQDGPSWGTTIGKLVPSCDKLGSKLGTCWAKLGQPRWDQIGPSWG